MAIAKTSPKGFWNIMKSISVAEIAKEANRPLSVAIVGEMAQREEAIAALNDVAPSGEMEGERKPRALPASPFVQGFDTMSPDHQFPVTPGVFDFVIDMGGGRQDAPEGIPVYSVSDLGGWENTLERILEDRPEMALALARNFPVFRRRVSQRLITQTATANAQFAIVTGVATVFPIFDLLLPPTALSDILVLTKNQIMMTLRLAAAYGLDLNYKSRSKELLPILGNAFGWRSIARELVGLVPGGVGLVAKATIAYAGTVTVGKAAQLYYETGESVTKAQAKKLYMDAYETSKERVRALASSLRSRGGGGGGDGGSKRLPAPDTEPEAMPSTEARDLVPASADTGQD